MVSLKVLRIYNKTVSKKDFLEFAVLIFGISIEGGYFCRPKKNKG
jgi:hypothetical protein